MVLSRSSSLKEAIPQTVPTAGFTPPCDYSSFADNFDLSLLPGEDNPIPVSPSTTLYACSPLSKQCGLESTPSPTAYIPNSPQNIENSDIDFGPDFQKLLGPELEKPKQHYPTSPIGNVYLEVPLNKTYPSSPSGSLSPYSPQRLLSPNEQFSTFPSPSLDHQTLYPSSPSDGSSYPHSPNSYYSFSDNSYQFVKKEFYPNSPSYPTYIKEETYLSSCNSPTSPPSYLNLSSNASNASSSDFLNLLDSAIIKQETSVDFENILQTLQNAATHVVPEKPKDHQLLREVLRDTSFQRKFNIKTFDFPLLEGAIKMEESSSSDVLGPCNEQLPREEIEPVLNLAIEQMRKDVSNTCTALGISPDPSRWSSANVLSWLQWTSVQFGLPPPAIDQWDLTGSNLIQVTEEEFTRRSPQGGSILYAQLEIWKAACSEDDFNAKWLPECNSSNASSGDVSDDDGEESTSEADLSKATTSKGTGSSHIHLWQFLKELLASPQTHGSCIRWIDRAKGIFKIEDSVKVARLWGKRKNRPAMNYDKLSRSIRQYYKKGIMKKTERSQRLVYQFCHPYSL